MKPIRMISLDMDDTLLRSDLTISSRTRNAIKRTEAAGVIMVLASGRIPEAMEHFSHQLGLDKRFGYLISYNGSLVQESHSGHVVHESRLDEEMALTVCDLADSEGFPLLMYQDDIMYVSRQNEYSGYDQKLTGLRQVVVENFRAMVADGCYKLIIPGDPKVLGSWEEIVRNVLEDNVTVFTSRPYFLEIMPKHTDKGTALAKVAEISGVTAEEVLAIGDSMNDEAMIRWAGVGVVMANGDERIKSIADFVSEYTNDDDGVADIIEKFIFGKG
ncbi:MAG: Cof-type HAD-IIB family hydrolase [Treponema sp.]|jgi:Cof subfamily protein (haloacid dehalogenase superfamily)|nr:Cof-type HAD-IIB family hydrolase [Treponema sp.]